MTWQHLDSMINMDIVASIEKYMKRIYWFSIKHPNFANVRELIEYAVDKCKSPIATILRNDVNKPGAGFFSFVDPALYNSI